MLASTTKADLATLTNILGQGDDNGQHIDTSEINTDDYDIEKFDYSYVRTAEDVRELKLVLAVLRSGKEGYYPDLEQAVIKRLGDLDPAYLPPTKHTDEEKRQILNELQQWTSEIKAKESISLKNNPKTLDVTTKTDTSNTKPTSKSTTKPTKSKLNIPQITSKPSLPDSELKYLAENEKLKGNEAFKAGDLDEAETYYTRSLQLYPLPNVYTNRSLCYFKQSKFQQAEEDATSALKMGGEWRFKAYLRRANARKSRGRYVGAIKDLLRAIRLEPENPEPKKLLSETERKYRDVEGELAVTVTVDEDDWGVDEADEPSVQKNNDRAKKQEVKTNVNDNVDNVDNVKKVAEKKKLQIEEVEEEEEDEIWNPQEKPEKEEWIKPVEEIKKLKIVEVDEDDEEDEVYDG